MARLFRPFTLTGVKGLNSYCSTLTVAIPLVNQRSRHDFLTVYNFKTTLGGVSSLILRNDRVLHKSYSKTSLRNAQL